MNSDAIAAHLALQDWTPVRIPNGWGCVDKEGFGLAYIVRPEAPRNYGLRWLAPIEGAPAYMTKDDNGDPYTWDRVPTIVLGTIEENGFAGKPIASLDQSGKAALIRNFTDWDTSLPLAGANQIGGADFSFEEAQRRYAEQMPTANPSWFRDILGRRK